MGHSVLVFADGASSGNPGPGGWGAVIVTPKGEVLELGGGDRHTTNNRMELIAVISALEKVRRLEGPIEIFTDSAYVIRGITQWIWAWRKRSWKSSEGNDVANPDLWQALSALIAARPKDVSWHFVRGHSGIPGNERVDEIAVAFSKGNHIRLYQGPLLQYSVPIHDIPEDTSLPELKPKAEAKPKAHSYLSLVGNVAMRHSTWADCERRVKGQSGAKFKKALTPQDEETILKSWGKSAKDLKG